MDPTAKSLAQIADRSGFNASDVAYLAGLDKSRVCKLWDDRNWLDHIQGSSLQALIRVLPGVAEYVCNQSLHVPRTRLTTTLERAGLAVDEAAFTRLVNSGVPEQYLTNALETAVKIMAGDLVDAAAHLMRFWGKTQDSALGYLFEAAPGRGILRDSAPLVEASAAMADQLAARVTTSFHAVIAQATLAHHVAKARGIQLGQVAPPTKYQSAFAYRSSAVGMIIRTGDVALSEQYGRAVAKVVLLGLIEDWAFPTYMRDAQVTRDFSLPRTLPLQRTAGEVVQELGAYNEAYVHYLTTVYLPRALGFDPTFGQQLPRLLTGIRVRRDTASNVAVRHACDQFLRLASSAPSAR